MSASLRYRTFPSLATNGVKSKIAVDYRAATVAAAGNRTGSRLQTLHNLGQVIGAKYHIKQKASVSVYHLRHYMRPKNEYESNHAEYI